MTQGIFDIGNAKEFFASIQHRCGLYPACTVKSTEDLLYIIMGLNHLREWIAPGFGIKSDGTWPTSNTPAQALSRKVYEDPSHQ
jgi:hypothetical protein